MSDIYIVEKIPSLAGFGNIIPEKYDYHKKIVAPGKNLLLKGAYLKWYELYPPGLRINEEQVSETRRFLNSEAESGRLNFNNELGFVILHRAGDYLLLLLTTWRNVNEMWESIYFKDAERGDTFKELKFNEGHKGTFCVWELGIVWHERNAWLHFTRSERDEKAKLNYMNDRFSGEI